MPLGTSSGPTALSTLEPVGTKRAKRAPLDSTPAGNVARPKADSNELLRLQRLAGNRAVTAYIGGSAALQREKLTPEEKRQRLEGLQQIPGSAVTEQGLRAALGDVWDRYANLDKAQARERCKVAAIDVSSQLDAKGIGHDWFGVTWWTGWGSGSLNHYAIVAQDMVIDPTGQQFNGGYASITRYSTWLSDLKSRIPTANLGRYMRGSYQDAKTLAGFGTETYFDLDHLGEPIHDYDPAYLARVKRAILARG